MNDQNAAAVGHYASRHSRSVPKYMAVLERAIFDPDDETTVGELLAFLQGLAWRAKNATEDRFA